MLNSLDFYRWAGRTAGKARKNRDEGLARHTTDHYRRALRLEAEVDRLVCSQAFEEAYREAAAVPVAYFR